MVKIIDKIQDPFTPTNSQYQPLLETAVMLHRRNEFRPSFPTYLLEVSQTVRLNASDSLTNTQPKTEDNEVICKANCQISTWKR